jgi:hypothetical protein
MIEAEKAFGEIPFPRARAQRSRNEFGTRLGAAWPHEDGEGMNLQMGAPCLCRLEI